MDNEHPVLFRGMTKSPTIDALKKCLRELVEIRKRVLKIEKLVFPITGKGGKDGKDT